MARTIRIILLLLVLATVAQQAWLAHSRATSWDDPLRVSIYPLNGDGRAATMQYIQRIDRETFLPIEDFFKTQSQRHGRMLYHPVRLTLAPQITVLPPARPHPANAIETLLWSLQLRWWAWRNDTRSNDARPQVRLFVLFFDPEYHRSLAHSSGLERGMIGLVNVFATDAMAGSNNVVITHELLHTLGATDKYDLTTNQPQFPHGYAEPERTPRLPQELAEIMAGRIPRSPIQADIPDSLDDSLIGPLTASEIGWKHTP